MSEKNHTLKCKKEACSLNLFQLNWSIKPIRKYGYKYRKYSIAVGTVSVQYTSAFAVIGHFQILFYSYITTAFSMQLYLQIC